LKSDIGLWRNNKEKIMEEKQESINRVRNQDKKIIKLKKK
jgi:hypothetical protein